ncbi:DUF2723 domain-containing protein [Pedobacter antarcticus]|uniref:DUF2723 domain-containing protein n=1 Tax=Pedobacter antarcticus TaxID=34086 RepID=UPI00292E14C2|nr:DUF2723 domain-containing protein [Pedobacter antarcticus]
MKVSISQQEQVRSCLNEFGLTKQLKDEIYDHILSALETDKGAPFDLNKIKSHIKQDFSEIINQPKVVLRYKRLNILFGWGVFLIALATYWLTMEPTVSFWDCGEFIATANKLQVGHQPGAPLFLMIGKMFSLLAMGETSRIAYWVNWSAAVASAATIMFLFWTITALALKVKSGKNLQSNTWVILAAGTVGALAYTFSDTFWFSAVESEVYALSSLFTAITFWAVFRWESTADNRWLLFIAFIIGLSIGIHLLSLLIIPAVTLAWYFHHYSKTTFKGLLKAFLAGCTIVGLVQFILIQYTVSFAAYTDLFFVNQLKLPFGSGALTSLIIITLILFSGIRYSIKKHYPKLNLALLSTVFLMFGFSSYMLIIIRADAKTNINLSNPDNPFSLFDYLSRSSYGSTPLLYGQTFDAKNIANLPKENTYRKGKTSYEVSGSRYQQKFDKNLIFPRTYSQKPGHAQYYRDWLDLGENEGPDMLSNLKFFSSWQVGFMYWRYFLWNFSGRQNDIQGQGEIQNGNWLSGLDFIDAPRLGSQENLPDRMKANEGRNVYFGIPLILGLCGLFWMSRKDKSALILVITVFFFTGIAIILYLNQDPFQVRDRDYAYAGSFYAFAIFIGFGVFFLQDYFSKLMSPKWSLTIVTAFCMLTVPVRMATQNWNDHDRSAKTTALDWARNYLNSCEKDAILFTNADNDTYPLWYAQEVEGIRTDIRVISLQFLQDPSFINQLRKPLNESPAIPMQMKEEQYVDGVRDYLPYVDYGIKDSVELKDLLAVMTSEDKSDQVEMADGTFMNFLPARKLKMTIDANALVQTGTLPADEIHKAASSMEWTFKKNYAGKGDLALFDILVQNNWKRPIYFATSVSEDSYAGMDDYLYLEGYAYRLLPIAHQKEELPDKRERTNTAVLYKNMIEKLDFAGFKKSTYLDPESRRILNSTWELNNTLTANLIKEGKGKEAGLILNKGLDQLPLRNYNVSDTIYRMYTVQNLYALNRNKEAETLVRQTAGFLEQEFNYVYTLPPDFQRRYLQEIRFGLGILNGLEDISKGYKRDKLSTELRQQFMKAADRFGIKV